MAYNIPEYDVRNFSFGPGILYVGPAGTTPTIDVGAVDVGAELAITRTVIDILQGSPRTLAKRFAQVEEVTLSVSGFEWDVTKLRYALGAGTVEETPAEDRFKFGGDFNFTDIALCFKHRLPAGHTIEIRIWRAQGTGEFTLTFAEDAHTFPYAFRAVESKTNWAGEPLPENERLFEVVRIK
jgi:hypothetical protein